jgi:hypothetical protein
MGAWHRYCEGLGDARRGRLIARGGRPESEPPSAGGCGFDEGESELVSMTGGASSTGADRDESKEVVEDL